MIRQTLVILASLVVLTSLFGNNGQQKAGTLYPVKRGGKFGFVDKTGKSS